MTSSNGRDDDASREPQPETVDESGALPGSVPRSIGKYTLKGVIASGGMGTVYRAVQEQPRRTVAVKVMNPGVTSNSALRRFEYESQLLGRLRHPGIAQVFEAGTHGEGPTAVPYFAMEYIPNPRSITEHATEKKLRTRKKLELFALVCDAVHHGHQKGIVHRDLKPGNILVGPDGQPKVIDFGVARATDSDMALTGMQTDIGQLIGTVQYMSPEQCEADPHDVDTRSDVYALGVVLYEMLCGELPYRLANTPIYEATRMIREQDPARPSTLNPKLRGDVETIVLKALDKDRDRRYQSAAELAQDLRRYLGGDAIMARPDSFTYQCRVFIRRNRGVLAALATILLVVAAGTVVSVVLYFKGETNRLRAEQQQDKARAAEVYLRDLVSSVDPTKFGEQVQVSVLLDRFGENIDGRFADQPEVEATVREALAGSYMYLNFLQQTEHSDEHARAAENHMMRALEIREETLGADDPQTLQTRNMIAQLLGYGLNLEKAEELRRENLRLLEAKFGPEHEETLDALGELSSLLRKLGKYEEAETLIRRELAIHRRQAGEEDANTVGSLAALARVRQAHGDYEEAEKLKRQVLEARRKQDPDGSTSVDSAISALADIYVVRGKLEEAEALYDTAFDPGSLAIEKWYGTRTESLGGAGDGAAIFVFWEPWCPFSQAYIPVAQELHRANPQPGLEIIGLTSLSRDSTEEQAVDFIRRNNLTFPNCRHTGPGFSDLGFTSYPAALAVRNGRVLFKGHPELLSPAFAEGLIGN